MQHMPESRKMADRKQNSIHKQAYRGRKSYGGGAESMDSAQRPAGKEVFNTSGLVYKELNLKEKLPAMSEEEQIGLLASNGKLVKRPLVVTDTFVLVGFKADEWEKLK